jgi:hypothetical protein
MSKYLILIYGDEQRWAAMSPAEATEVVDGHRAFRAAAGTALLGGHELEPSHAAVSLRADERRQVTRTDGPFADTKEGIGGYCLIEAPDLDAAVALAGLLPEVYASHSGVEVRPVHESGS